MCSVSFAVDLRDIPGGDNTFGNASVLSAWIGFSDELPAVSNRSAPFCMDAREVDLGGWGTVRQWAMANGYTDLSPGSSGGREGSSQSLEHPVVDVSWYDCVKWCNARSEMDGLRPVYYTEPSFSAVYRAGGVDIVNAWVDWNASGYRLPTEAEWEYAARGGLAGQDYPWTNRTVVPVESLTSALANYAGEQAQIPGHYPANGFGLCDMAGNVSEWCWDWYRTDRNTLLPGNPAAWAAGPDEMPLDACRSVRGGSWMSGPEFLRCSAREMTRPAEQHPYLGFRCARNRLGGLVLSSNTLAFAGGYQGIDPDSLMITITNSGGASYTWSCSSTPAWLNIAPTSGTVQVGGCMVFTNRASLAGLDAGIYAATVTVSSATATNVPQNIGVSLVIARKSQTITFANPGTQWTTNVTSLTATTVSGLPVSLAVVSGPATLSTNVSPATLSYSGAGNVTIAATQTGNANWQAAAVSNSFTVNLPAPVAVYRFWSGSLNCHFFTASEAEKNGLIANSASVWTYEGIAFYAHAQAVEGSKPVHRLWSDRFQGHLYTISDAEKAKAVARGFLYDGYAWYAFTNQTSGTLPVYRFVARKSKKLFFTISEAEKVSLISNSSAYWSYKGIAWYAYPLAQNVQPAMNALQDSEDPLGVLDASVVDHSGAVASDVAFSLSYGSDKVVEATLHDPQTNGFIQVLEPTVSPRELVIPYLPFGQRYWLSVMSRDVGEESSTLDYGGWLGRVAELPLEAITTVEVDAGMPIGLPVEMISLPESEGPLSLLVYEPTSDQLIQTLTGLEGGSIYELTVSAWNQWYLLEIEDETSGVLLDTLWIGHMRTH